MRREKSKTLKLAANVPNIVCGYEFKSDSTIAGKPEKTPPCNQSSENYSGVRMALELCTLLAIVE